MDPFWTAIIGGMVVAALTIPVSTWLQSRFQVRTAKEIRRQDRAEQALVRVIEELQRVVETGQNSQGLMDHYGDEYVQGDVWEPVGRTVEQMRRRWEAGLRQVLKDPDIRTGMSDLFDASDHCHQLFDPSSGSGDYRRGLDSVVNAALSLEGRIEGMLLR